LILSRHAACFPVAIWLAAMKNHNFGDINDYKKYGLLRILSNHGQLKVGCAGC